MNMRTLVAAAIALFLLLILITAWVLYPREGLRQVFVDIPRGTPTRDMARMLEDAGVLQSQWQFLVLRAVRPSASLQAGEYLFDKPASAWEVFDRIARGDIFYYTVTVPEGHNMFDIAAHLEAQGLMSIEEFLEAARDPSPIQDLAPQAPTLEGYLFPDTYRITRNTTPVQLLRQMTDRFRRAWRSLGPPEVNVHELVTLASLVEKESRVPSERTLVASVFANRLRVGMPLQCDPTTIYAALLEGRYRGTIYRSDLQSRHPYNTYRHAGLPPGPIANPGLESLKAALNPAESGYYYFVVRPDGTGAHEFSEGLAEHERAVQQYRRALRTTNQTNGTERLAGGAPAGGDNRNGVAATPGPPGAN